MNAPETNQPGKVSLEELLQLKRAERPAPEFWDRFEQDLRVKQLAAIVEKRPWWVALRLPQAARTMAGLSLQLPLGAAAVLAFSFVVVRDYRLATMAHEVVTAAPARSVVVMGTVAPTLVVASASAAVATQGAVAGASGTLAQAILPSAAAPLPKASIGAVVAVVAPIPPSPPAGPVVEFPAVAQTLGELSSVAFSDPVSNEPEHSFETFFDVGAVGTTAHLALAERVGRAARTAPTSAREARLGRILAGLVVADNSLDRDGSNLSQVREVMAGAMSDGRGYDSVGRIGLGGDRLVLKF